MHDVNDLSIRLQVESGCATLTVAGELDVFTAVQLRLSANEALQTGRAKLVLDLAGISFIDARGIDTLIHIGAQCSETGREFAVRNPSPAVIRMERLTQIDPALLPREEAG